MAFLKPRDIDSEIVSPRPIIVRRPGGGVGDPSSTFTGDYLLVAGADGVAACSRAAHGSVPVDIVSRRSPCDSHYNYNHNHYAGAQRSHRASSPRTSMLLSNFSASANTADLDLLSAHRRRAAAEYGTSNNSDPLLASARQERGSSAPRNYSLFGANADDETLDNFATGNNCSPPLGQKRRERELEHIREAHQRRMQQMSDQHVFRPPSAAAIVTQRGVVKKMNLPTPPPPGASGGRPTSSAHHRRAAAAFVAAPVSPRYPSTQQQQQRGAARSVSPRVSSTTTLQQQQQRIRQNVSSAAAIAAAAASVSYGTTAAAAAAAAAQPQRQSPRKAVATPGTLRIMQGQLSNGMRLGKVVGIAMQSARDRIYRPRTEQDREKHFATLFPNSSCGNNLNNGCIDHSRRNEALQSFYSPSRSRAGVPTATNLAASDAMLNMSSSSLSGVINRRDVSSTKKDFFHAIEFDPYALSLLSALPPLSSSSDPFFAARAELRRHHCVDPSPGALVMHTALGHLRSTGAVPYLLDVSFGVLAMRPKHTEEEKLRMTDDEKLRMTEDNAFDALSDESGGGSGDDDEENEDDDDDGIFGSAAAATAAVGTANLSRHTNKKLQSYHKSVFGHKAGASVSDDPPSPHSMFRKTAQELLAPLPSVAFDVAGSQIEHPQPPLQQQFGSAEALQRAAAHDRNKKMLEQHRKEYQRLKMQNNKDAVGGSGDPFDANEIIHSGVTVRIDGRALSDPSQRVTRPTFRIFTIFCDRHPLPGLQHVCRVQMPKPAPMSWSPEDIIVCFGWRADKDIDTNIGNVVGDGFFSNSQQRVMENGWEATLMERRLVFQFFGAPDEADLTREQGGSQSDHPRRRAAAALSASQRGRQLGNRGTFHRGESDSGLDLRQLQEKRREDNFADADSLLNLERENGPRGARHKPFRVHDFEMHNAALCGYQPFTWEAFSHEFSRAVGEAFLRGLCKNTRT